jgi:Ca2+-binding EF-hand superfamily protein
LAEKIENIQKPDRSKQFKSMSKKPISTLEFLLESLQQKIRIQFPGNLEAFRFFDIHSNQKCKKEHFLFNCAYFLSDFEPLEVMELFDLLDINKDGTLDQRKFDALFRGVVGGWNSHGHEITKSILRADINTLGNNVDICKALNTIDKIGPTTQEMYGYPHYFGRTMQKVHKRDSHRSMQNS